MSTKNELLSKCFTKCDNESWEVFSEVRILWLQKKKVIPLKAKYNEGLHVFILIFDVLLTKQTSNNDRLQVLDFN